MGERELHESDLVPLIYSLQHNGGMEWIVQMCYMLYNFTVRACVQGSSEGSIQVHRGCQRPPKEVVDWAMEGT